MTDRQQVTLDRFAKFALREQSPERAAIGDALAAALRELHWLRGEVGRLESRCYLQRAEIRQLAAALRERDAEVTGC